MRRTYYVSRITGWNSHIFRESATRRNTLYNIRDTETGGFVC